jgi:hypothetical protein
MPLGKSRSHGQARSGKPTGEDYTNFRTAHLKEFTLPTVLPIVLQFLFKNILPKPQKRD